MNPLRVQSLAKTFTMHLRDGVVLPVVDNVIVADPSGAISVATMDQFLDAGGDAIIRTGLSPARYFVPGDQPK